MYVFNAVLSCISASLLKGLKHANIVTLHDIIHVKESLTFVFEYVVSMNNFYSFQRRGKGSNIPDQKSSRGAT